MTLSNNGAFGGKGGGREHRLCVNLFGNPILLAGLRGYRPGDSRRPKARARVSGNKVSIVCKE